MATEAQKIPEHLLFSLNSYIKFGQRCGHFMSAVISGDLFTAVRRADLESRKHITHIALYLEQHAPADCYGNAEKMAKWIENEGLAQFDGELAKELSRGLVEA